MLPWRRAKLPVITLGGVNWFVHRSERGKAAALTNADAITACQIPPLSKYVGKIVTPYGFRVVRCQGEQQYDGSWSVVIDVDNDAAPLGIYDPIRGDVQYLELYDRIAA